MQLCFLETFWSFRGLLLGFVKWDFSCFSSWLRLYPSVNFPQCPWIVRFFLVTGGNGSYSCPVWTSGIVPCNEFEDRIIMGERDSLSCMASDARSISGPCAVDVINQRCPLVTSEAGGKFTLRTSEPLHFGSFSMHTWAWGPMDFCISIALSILTLPLRPFAPWPDPWAPALLSQLRDSTGFCLGSFSESQPGSPSRQ